MIGYMRYLYSFFLPSFILRHVINLHKYCPRNYSAFKARKLEIRTNFILVFDS